MQKVLTVLIKGRATDKSKFLADLSNLKAKVTCLMCTNVFTKPVRLKCGHLFCETCLNAEYCFVCQCKYKTFVHVQEYEELAANIFAIIKELEKVINGTVTTDLEQTVSTPKIESDKLATTTVTKFLNVNETNDNVMHKDENMQSIAPNSSNSNCIATAKLSTRLKKLGRPRKNTENVAVKELEDEIGDASMNNKSTASLDIEVKRRFKPLHKKSVNIKPIHEAENLQIEACSEDGETELHPEDQKINTEPSTLIETLPSKGWSGMKKVSKALNVSRKRKLPVELGVTNSKRKKSNKKSTSLLIENEHNAENIENTSTLNKIPKDSNLKTSKRKSSICQETKATNISLNNQASHVNDVVQESNTQFMSPNKSLNDKNKDITSTLDKNDCSNIEQCASIEMVPETPKQSTPRRGRPKINTKGKNSPPKDTKQIFSGKSPISALMRTRVLNSSLTSKDISHDSLEISEETNSNLKRKPRSIKKNENLKPEKKEKEAATPNPNSCSNIFPNTNSKEECNKLIQTYEKNESWETLVEEFVHIYERILNFENEIVYSPTNIADATYNKHSDNCFFHLLLHLKKMNANIQFIKNLFDKCSKQICSFKRTDCEYKLYNDAEVQTEDCHPKGGFTISSNEEFQTPARVDVFIQTEEIAERKNDEICKETACLNIDDPVISNSQCIHKIDKINESHEVKTFMTKAFRKLYDHQDHMMAEESDEDENSECDSQLIIMLDNVSNKRQCFNNAKPRFPYDVNDNMKQNLENVSFEFESNKENAEVTNMYDHLDNMLVNYDLNTRALSEENEGSTKSVCFTTNAIHNQNPSINTATQSDDPDVVENTEDILGDLKETKMLRPLNLKCNTNFDNEPDIIECTEDVLRYSRDLKTLKSTNLQFNVDMFDNQCNDSDIIEETENILGQSNLKFNTNEGIVSNDSDIIEETENILGQSHLKFNTNEGIVSNESRNPDIFLHTENIVEDLSNSNLKTTKFRILENVQINSNLIENEVYDENFDNDVIPGTPEHCLENSTTETCDDIDIIPPPINFADSNRLANSFRENDNKDEHVLNMSFGMCSQKSLKISDYKSHKDDRSISHTTIIENANKSKIEKFSQLPILTETSENKFNSSTKTAEQSKNNTCKPKPVVSCTRSSREQILGIDLLQKKDIITYVSSFSKEVTHLIVQTKDGNCLKDHTIKYVLGVAAGIWILNYDWIVKCLEKNTIVDEVPYEVFDISGVPGPKFSRTAYDRRLFENFKIYAAPPFYCTKINEIEDAITMLGGEIASSLNEFHVKNDKTYLVIAEGSATEEIDTYNNWFDLYGVLTVDVEWLSTSVGQFRVLGVKPYLLCDSNTSENGSSVLLDGDIST